jgi:hypothetical protein
MPKHVVEEFLKNIYKGWNFKIRFKTVLHLRVCISDVHYELTCVADILVIIVVLLM